MTPLLRLVTPDATPEEIATLIVVFSTINTPATPQHVKGAPSEWPASNRLRNARQLPSRSWRASSLPR